MWRVGAVLVLAAVFAEGSFADFDDGHPLERYKRYPYDCPPHCWRRPSYPPPPPPYWPPPHHGPPPPPPPEWYQFQQPAYNEAYSQAKTEDKSQAIQAFPESHQNQGQTQSQGQPCKTCGENTAVSNAQSDTGSAIAVAIARAKAGPK